MNASIFAALLLAVLLQVNQPASGTFSQASESIKKYFQASSLHQPANHELMKELKIIRAILEKDHSSTFPPGVPNPSTGPLIASGSINGDHSGINVNEGAISGNGDSKF